MISHKIPKRIARNGHIHHALAEAHRGTTSSSGLRSHPGDARELQMSLIYGWLEQEHARGPYYFTKRGKEMLDLLGHYPKFEYKKVNYTPEPMKTGTQVRIPKHHTPIPKWLEYFKTHVW